MRGVDRGVDNLVDILSDRHQAWLCGLCHFFEQRLKIISACAAIPGMQRELVAFLERNSGNTQPG